MSLSAGAFRCHRGPVNPMVASKLNHALIPIRTQLLPEHLRRFRHHHCHGVLPHAGAHRRHEGANAPADSPADHLHAGAHASPHQEPHSPPHHSSNESSDHPSNTWPYAHAYTAPHFYVKLGEPRSLKTREMDCGCASSDLVAMWLGKPVPLFIRWTGNGSGPSLTTSYCYN